MRFSLCYKCSASKTAMKTSGMGGEQKEKMTKNLTVKVNKSGNNERGLSLEKFTAVFL